MQQAEHLIRQQYRHSHCRNCGEQFVKNYCSHCGQKQEEHRIGLGSLLHEIPHAIYHVDHGFFYNLIQLFKRPGPAIREYLEGKRKPFFNPITYLAILLLFNLFAVKITDLHYYDTEELRRMTKEEAAFILEYDAAQWWFLEHTYLYMLVAIPLCALFTYGWFRLFRLRYNFAEQVIILMFIIAQGVCIQSLIYLSAGWVKNGAFIRGMEIVNLLLMLSYAVYAFYQLLRPERKKGRVLTGSLLAAFMVMVIMLGSAYGLMYLSKAIF